MQTLYAIKNVLIVCLLQTAVQCCNVRNMKNEITDKQIIEALGGAAEVARKLNIKSRHTVFAWLARGIPPKYRVEDKHRAMWRNGAKLAEKAMQQ